MNPLEIDGRPGRRPFADAARQLGLTDAHLRACGPGLAQVDLESLEREPSRDHARYVVVASTTAAGRIRPASSAVLGVAAALRRIGVRVVGTVGLPGPGAEPAVRGWREGEDPTGVRHAVRAAGELFGGDEVLAEELRAVLALSCDAADMQLRLARLDGRRAASADVVQRVLRGALSPCLGQTEDGTPVFLHGGASEAGGPGCASVIADRLGHRCADLVATAMAAPAVSGAERFFNIKCRASGLRPRAAVLECAVGEPAAALAEQVRVFRLHGLPVVIAVRRCPGDDGAAVDASLAAARAAGALEAVGGAEHLARAVARAVAEPAGFRFLYPLSAPPRAKLEMVATRVHGRTAVTYLPRAERALDQIEELGGGGLPVCVVVAPGQGSREVESGRARRFLVEAAEVRPAAGYVRVLVGEG